MTEALLGVDFLLLAEVKMTVCDISLLTFTKYNQIDIFVYYGHAIRCVELCGVITGVTRGSLITTFTLDDSTSTIECSVWNDCIVEEFRLGDEVKSIGKPKAWKNSIQIACHKIFVFKNFNCGLLHHCQSISLKREYEKKQVLPFKTESDLNTPFENTTVKLSLVNVSYPTWVEIGFKEYLLLYLREINVKAFSVLKLWCDFELHSDTFKAYKLSHKNCTTTSGNPWDLLFNTIHQLFIEGELIKTSNGFYMLVNENLLADELVEILNSSDCEEGISLNQIIEKHHQNENSPNFSKEKVTRTLNKLVRTNRVYYTLQQMYRVV